MNDMQRAIEGCILDTAVGDAMGLACEGLGRAQQLKFFPELTGYRLQFGRGLCSDDTEHTFCSRNRLSRPAAIPAGSRAPSQAQAAASRSGQ